MTAGDGAQEQTRRHAAAAEERRKRLEPAEGAERSGTAGAEGERKVGALLAATGGGHLVLHDLPWPGRPRATVDHVVVGPRTVVVVDAKDWSGRVTVHDGVLWQNGRPRPQAAESVIRAVAAVAAVLDPGHRTSVRGVVCLAGGGADLLPVEMDGVLVTGRDHVLAAVRSLPGGRLDPAEVPGVVERLRSTGGSRRAATAGPTRRRRTRARGRGLPGLAMVAVAAAATLVTGVDGVVALLQPVVDILVAGEAAGR